MLLLWQSTGMVGISWVDLDLNLDLRTDGQYGVFCCTWPFVRYIDIPLHVASTCESSYDLRRDYTTTSGRTRLMDCFHAASLTQPVTMISEW